LVPGASMIEVREAHRDLCLVWDASRFDDNPQVQKKAHGQLRRIDEAFECIRIHHGETPKNAEGTVSTNRSGRVSVERTGEGSDREEGSASLYQEIFQKRQDKTQRQIPVGWIIAVMMVLVVGVIYLGGPVDENESEGPPSPFPIEEPLEKGGGIQIAGVEPGDLTSSSLQLDGQSDATEPSVETTRDSLQPAGSSSVSPANLPAKVEPNPRSPLQSFPSGETPEAEIPVAEPEESRPENRPVLERDAVLLVEETADPTGQEIQEDEDSNTAVEILKEKSVLARQLIEGNGEVNLSYQQWTTVRRSPPEFWIDVVVLRTTDGGELHLVWSVNIDTGVVQPLSQAARDVETNP
ncbi:MAG: hypothetical protein V3R94_01295, partial [Acidobacteriota bacterium]